MFCNGSGRGRFALLFVICMQTKRDRMDCGGGARRLANKSGGETGDS